MSKKFIIVVCCVLLVVAAVYTFLNITLNSIIDDKYVNMNFETKRIVLIIPHPDNEYWQQVADGLTKGCDEENISLEIRQTISGENSEEIIQMIETAIDEQVDAIVLKGDLEGGETVLERAKANNVSVVFIDSDFIDFDRDFYIGTDNYSAGKALAQSVIESSITYQNQKLNIAVIAPEQNGGNIMQRKQGFIDLCQNYENVNVTTFLDNEWSSSVAVGQINTILDTMPEITTIVTLEGYGTIALNTVNNRRDVEGVKMYGFDLESEFLKDMIANEQIEGIINQNQYKFGYLCAGKLVELWEQGSLEEDTIYVPIQYIDKTNVE